MVHRKKLPPPSLQESEGEEFSDGSDGSEVSSIDNPAEDGWVFPIVLPGAKRTEYEAVCFFDVDIVDLTAVSTLQALKEAQLKVSDLQMTVRKLHMQNADLSMRLKESKSDPSSSGKKVGLSGLDLRISQFAKLFGVMHEPFVPPSALLAARPDTSTSSTHADRYGSELAKVQGITAELYEVLPKEMHSDLKSSPKFRAAV
jgi:hypothetical protein